MKSKLLMNKKFLFAFVLIFMVLTFIPIEDKQNFQLSGFAAFLVNPCQYLAMVFTLMLTMFVSSSKGFKLYLEKHLNQKFICILIYLVAIISIVLFILKVTEVWGTWSTVGLYLITVLIMPIILDGVISKIEALLLGAGAIYVLIALWEMPYQFGLWKYYELPQGETTVDIVNQIVFLTPFILLGLAIITIIVINNFKSLKFHWKLPVIFLGYTIVGYLIRFSTGFWTDIYYSLKNSAWMYSSPNNGMLILYRTTKVALNLSFLTLFINWKKVGKYESR